MSLVPVTLSLKVYLKVSFLCLLLFLFYFNDLASALNDDAIIALFVDVSILTTARKREDAEATAQ